MRRLEPVLDFLARYSGTFFDSPAPNVCIGGGGTTAALRRDVGRGLNNKREHLSGGDI